MYVEPVAYTAVLLGASGNVGGQILHLLVQSPLCKKVVVVTRRNLGDGAIFRGGSQRRAVTAYAW